MATNQGQLLFEGGFGAIPPGAIHKNSNVKDWFMRTALQIIEENKQPRCHRTGPTYFSVKKRFIPRVTHGMILHQQNLELLMGQFYTSTTLMYSRDCFTPVQLV